MDASQKKQAVRARISGIFEHDPALLRNELPARSLLSSTEYTRARTVLAYMSTPYEIFTASILRDCISSGRRLVLPRVASKSAAMTLHLVSNLDVDLERGKLGFSQPKKILPCIQPHELDLIIAPGIAFDPRGYRLGRGAGHYDRLLASSGLRAMIVAIAAEAQIVDELPVEPHDRPVHLIFTPARVIRCAPIS